MLKSDPITRRDAQHSTLLARSDRLSNDRPVAGWNECVIDAILESPALPTVFPTTADILCGYADALGDEGFAAIESLARPLAAVLPILREVFARPERKKVYWGIGTVRTRDEAIAAAMLRPDFLVSPAFSRNVLEVAVESGIPYIPGVYTFQDVQNVIDAFSEYGLNARLLKLCPAMGITAEYLQALSGCFPGIVFCPTGDTSLDTYARWKRMPEIVAPMGSGLVPSAWLEARDFAAVRQRLRLIRSISDELAMDRNRE